MTWLQFFIFGLHSPHSRFCHEDSSITDDDLDIMNSNTRERL